MSKFRETQATGTDFNLGLIRGSDDSPVGLRLDLGYDRFKGKSVNSITGSDKRIVSGTVELVISSSGHLIKPYLLAGGGAYKITEKPAVPDARLRFGYNAGLGFTVPLFSRAFYLETRMNVVPQTHATPVRYLPVVLGVLF